MAPSRCRRRGTPHRRARARRNRDWGRQRQGAPCAAAAFSRRRQYQCLPRRIPPVGGRARLSRTPGLARNHGLDRRGASLTSFKEKLLKIGAKVVSHGGYVVFQMAEVAISRQMFQEILRLIAELRPQSPPAPA